MDDATNSGAPAPAESGQAASEVASVGDNPTMTSLLGETGDGESETTTAEPQASPDDDLDEIDWEDGQKYKVPKVLKDAFLRQSDYTKKTQEVAEQRRVHEAEIGKFKGERESFAADQKRREDTFKDVQEVMRADWQIEGINERIGQYDKLDWERLQTEDPDKANLYWRQRELLKEQRADLQGKRDGKTREINDRWTKANQDAADKAKQSQATAHEVLSKAIPKWSTETQKQITDFTVKNFGYSAKELSEVNDPRIVVALHYARLGKLAEQKLRNPTAPVAGKQTPVTTVPGSKSSKPVTGPRDDMTADEWFKAEIERTTRKKA